jgi:hypothetical protein
MQLQFDFADAWCFEKLRQLSRDFAQDFVSLGREGFPLPPCICLLGSNAEAMGIVAEQMTVSLVGKNIRIEFRKRMREKLDLKVQPETQIYYIDMDYFVEFLGSRTVISRNLF